MSITLPSAPIAQFDEYFDPKADDELAIVEKATGKTKKIKAQYFGQAAPSTNYKWVSGFDYAEDAIVEHEGNWYLSLQTPNLGKIPGTIAGGAYWQIQSKSPTGLVYWAAGVYTGDPVLVLKQIGSVHYIVRLVNATRPFLSSDFDAEFLAGDWEAIGGIVVGASSHFRGNYDASTNLFPAAGGSTGGVPQAGDEWVFSVAATNLNGEPWPVGTIAKALVSTPGQTASNWRLI